MHAATRGPTLKWGKQISNGGPGTTASPAGDGPDYQRSTLGDRSKTQHSTYAKTEQFITAKISANTLEQGSRTCLILRQRSSLLHKHKTAH